MASKDGKIQVGMHVPVETVELFKPWVGCVVTIQFRGEVQVEAKIVEIGPNVSTIVVTKVNKD